MAYHLDDTIAAVASPPGGAARAIVRLAGPETLRCVRACFAAQGEVDLATIARPTAVPGAAKLDGIAAHVPCDLYYWPGPRSYTGGPLAELHTLGSPPLVDAAVRTLCRAGARLAEPGEFTLRAFLSGRIDLTEAEAVLGVIDAADARQLDAALAQLAGGLSQPLDRLRDDLLDLLAQLEAGLDFADEDLPFITAAELDGRLASAGRQVAAIEEQLGSRRQSAAAIGAVLVGRPNSGKSSLFNALTGRALAGRPGAIVSPLPGTTRDYLVAEVDLEGVRVRLIDTAGMVPESTMENGDVERAAQAMAAEQNGQAQVRILCLDSTRPRDSWERGQLAARAAPSCLPVLTKCDARPWGDSAADAIRTSAVTGEGLDALRNGLRAAAMALSGSGGDAVAATSARCGESIRLAAACLDRARGLVLEGGVEELVAAEVRSALEEIGRIVGAVYTDDVLDRVFSRFCIGK